MDLSIFLFHDYRAYLNAHIEKAKNDEGLSLREWCEKAGIQVSLISMILKKKRNLTLESALKLKKALKHGNAEHTFLLHLMALSDSDSIHEKQAAFEKIKKFSKFKTSYSEQLPAHLYLKKWYHVAIREMAFLPEFSDDLKWIQRQLLYEVSIPEIRKALEFLLSNKLLVKASDGRIVPTDEHLKCMDGVYKLSLAHFHKQMLSHAVDSIEKSNSKERNLYGHTVCLSEEKISEAQLILEEALNKIASLKSDKSKAGRVYHFAFAGFPLTKKDGSYES